MPRKNKPASRLEKQTQAEFVRPRTSNAEDPGRFTITSWDESAKTYRDLRELRAKFTRGGRPRKKDRDRQMADEFLKRRSEFLKRKRKKSVTALMEDIGKDVGLGRSAAVQAVKKGCEAIVHDLGTTEMKDAVSQGRMSAVKVAVELAVGSATHSARDVPGPSTEVSQKSSAK